MAENQYIGARYVSKFFANPNGTSEWLGNVPYEPLTIVTYLGNSYTSKIPVPPGIGNPSLNPTYWALTSNYSYQVEQYRQEVMLLEQNVTDLGDQVDAIKAVINPNTFVERYYIFITDSFGDFGEFGFMQQVMKKIPTGHVWMNHQGGYGFKNGQFLSLLQAVEEDITDKKTITDIVFAGGNNDYGVAQTDINSAMSAIRQYTLTTYPNAKLWVCDTGYSKSGQNELRQMHINYKLCGANQTFKYIPLYRTLHHSSMFSDEVHPTRSGHDALAFGLENALVGGNGVIAWHVETTMSNIPETAGTGWNGLLTYDSNEDGVITITVAENKSIISPNLELTQTNKYIGQLSDWCTPETIYIPCLVNLNNTPTIINIIVNKTGAIFINAYKTVTVTALTFWGGATLYAKID